MDGAFKALVSEKGVGVVNDLLRKHREDCTLRLARIANGVEKGYTNGHPKKPTGR
jgi:hypothetical protein